MARIKKELVEQREAEVVQAFVNGASVKEANEALFTKHGKRMGLARIYELRAQVKAAQVSQAEVVETPAETPAVETTVETPAS